MISTNIFSSKGDNFIVNQSFSGNVANSLLFFLLSAVIIGVGCSSKELTRSKAESLIKDSADFKYPAAADLKRANENEPLFQEKSSDSETIEESKAKNLKGYWLDDPYLAVANHLGLITIEQTLTKEKPGIGTQVPPTRYFITKFRANNKGIALWKEIGLDSSDEAIPLAAKEFLKISGITQQGENQAIAEYSWKFVPNSFGKVFDPNSTEFKSLPVELQKQILGETGQPPRDRRANWEGERKSKAFFQRYDDGWRLVRILN